MTTPTTEALTAPSEITELVRKYGKNSNSFMTLYPGFQYFQTSSVSGAVPFLDMPHAWVGGAEPLAAPEDQAKLLSAFAEAAAEVKKAAILIPVGKEAAERAQDAGFHSLMVGSEPTFDLNRYPKTGRTWIDVVATAKTLEFKGATVKEFHPSAIPKGRLEELESIKQEWLDSRKMDPLGFLNKVEPWTLSEHKRYFSIEIFNRTLAFVAAIPIWPRRGWYLIDLMRKSDAPAGTTELLCLHSMRILRNSGAQEITMGVSPLAQIDRVQTFPLAFAEKHKLLYRFLLFLYNYGGSLYAAKTLYQYKLKFNPTQSEPVFLIYRSPQPRSSSVSGFGMEDRTLNSLEVLSVFQAFAQNGILKATWSGVARTLRQFRPSTYFKNLLNQTIVVRSIPKSWFQFFLRCKLSVALFTLNLLVFIFTSSSGNLKQTVAAEWSYSWKMFSHSPFHSLALSPFLHFNTAHLVANLILLSVFTGGLEYIAGTRITALCYFVPMLIANPLTSLSVLLFHSGVGETDVGASLGIFGTIGALCLFLTHGRIILGLFVSLTLVTALGTQQWIILNHITAILVGTLLGNLLLKR